MLEEYDPAEIRSRIIISKNNNESLLILQKALDQREGYQIINVFDYKNGHKIMVAKRQGEFECNILCEDCYLLHCDISYTNGKIKPLMHYPIYNFYYNF